MGHNAPWMLECPPFDVTPEQEDSFRHVLQARDVGFLTTDLPRWVFLQWLARQGYLLHGSRVGGLAELRPREGAQYQQPDEFSNTIGIYAAFDGLWAMMYALRGLTATGQSDMALQIRLGDGTWTTTKDFYALGYTGSPVSAGRELMGSGFVYVLDSVGFECSPAYLHEGLGYVQEAYAVNRRAVRPLMSVPVVPDDFPLPVWAYDDLLLRERARRDPWGFPWLQEE